MTKNDGTIDALNTDRLLIQDWSKILAKPSERKVMEAALAAMLTPTITHRLPLSMGFPGDYASISDWVDDRQAEAQILCVHDRQSDYLAGLVILWHDPDQQTPVTIHLGYFFGQNFWGRGFATEVLNSLITNLKTGPAFLLHAGVDRDNIASARVLEKVGFSKLPEQKSKGQLFFEYRSQ